MESVEKLETYRVVSGTFARRETGADGRTMIYGPKAKDGPLVQLDEATARRLGGQVEKENEVEHRTSAGMGGVPTREAGSGSQVGPGGTPAVPPQAPAPDAPAAEEAAATHELHGLNASDAAELVAGAETAADLDVLEAAEKAHPKYKPEGRTTVIKAVEARRAALAGS